MGRKRLPDTRPSQTAKIVCGNAEAYVTVGFYENNQPGEIFIKVSKMGSFTSTMFDMIALQASLLLQHGVPLKVLLDRWSHIKGDGGDLLAAIAASISNSVSLMGGIPDKGYEGCESTAASSVESGTPTSHT